MLRFHCMSARPSVEHDFRLEENRSVLRLSDICDCLAGRITKVPVERLSNLKNDRPDHLY
jgi:hypothetical protein